MNCPCKKKDEFQGIVFCVDCGLEFDEITLDEEFYALGRPEKIQKVKKLTVSDLRKQAKELGLKGYYKLKKKELEAFLQTKITKNEFDEPPLPLFEDSSDEPPLFEDSSDDD